MKDKLLAQLQLPGGDDIDAPSGVPTASGDGTLTNVISFIINSLMFVGIVAALIFLIIGGIKWITSNGDKEKLNSARKTIIFSIIGLVVIIFSFFIIQAINQILGVTTDA